MGISLFFGHFRSMSQKLQVDVGKVNEEKTLLSAIVKNTQGIISKRVTLFQAMAYNCGLKCECLSLPRN